MNNQVNINKVSSYIGIGLCSLAVGCQQQQQREFSTPNIIFILADDMGWGDVSINYPQGKIQTPHLDRLAMEGMRFTDAHAPSGVSTPSRYGLLTGNYLWRSSERIGGPITNLNGYSSALMQIGQPTVASLLRDHGYTTAVIGKWHLGLDWQLKEGIELSDLPPRVIRGSIRNLPSDVIDFTIPPLHGPLSFGFDFSYILPASLDMEPYVFLKNDVITSPLTGFTEGNDLDTGMTEAFWRPGLMAEDFDFQDVKPRFTRKVIQYITETAKTGQPFFLYYAMTGPHTPWLPCDDFKGRSEVGTFGDFMMMTDHTIGQILEAVREAGIEDNTIIIVSSDNGPFWRPNMIERYGHRAAGPFRGMKGDIWEAGHRVPFIVRWPGHIQPGSVSDALTCLTNLMATVSDIVGIERCALVGVDSYSILPVLLGQSETVPNQRAIVNQSSNGTLAIRTQEWKLIQARGSAGFSPSPRGENLPERQLFNMIDDPFETNNLYETRRDIVEKLSQLLEELKNKK